MTCKCRICVRGGDLAVREIGADRCLMESRITDLPGFTCNHQLLRFPLSSPLLLGLWQGQGEGRRREIFRFPAKFLELPLILWPIPSLKHNLPVWQDSGRQEWGFLLFKTWEGCIKLYTSTFLLPQQHSSCTEQPVFDSREE